MDKKRIIEFVKQTQSGCEQSICLNDMCKKNPDIGALDQISALRYITLEKKIDELFFCDEYGVIPSLTKETLRQMMIKNDTKFFEEEYVRYLARVEALGSGFVLGGNGEDGDIDFEFVSEVSNFIQNLPENTRVTMGSKLSEYRVSCF